MFGKKLILSIAFGLFASMLLFSGCSLSKTEKTTAVKDKSELIVALGAEPQGGFDPTTGWGRNGSPLFQSTLLKRDRHLKIIHDLATGYQVSEDGLIWTVTLRKDVKFSDGVPLTAADVKYTFETAMRSGSVVDLHSIQNVEVSDDYTVVFVLKQPRSTFVNSLITLGIVPKHAHDANYAQRPIGSGPFKFVQWDKGQQLIVEANPYYYGEKKPQFNKITFLYLSDDAAIAAVKAGKLDVAVVPPSFSKQRVQGMYLLAVDSVDNRGIMFPYRKAGGITDKGLDVGNDVTADIAIRKAINVAINRRALVDGVLEGKGMPAYTVCDGLPWWNPETVFKDADLNEAKKILAEAGWQDNDDDGILEKGSVKAQFTLLYPSIDTTRQSLAIAVADMLKPLGITIKAEGKSWDEIKNLKHANAVLFGWGSHTPLELHILYNSKNAGVENYNPGFYGNSAVDMYMEQALASTSEVEAYAYWKQVQWDGKTGVAAIGDAPWAWLVNLKHCYMIRENLDLGKPKVEPHGYGWPITDNIVEWHWQ